MTEAAALLRLARWLSPAFPTGAFAWSHGLEQAVRDGTVADADGLFDWLDALLRLGLLDRAKPLIEKLAALGYRNREFEALCKEKGAMERGN